MTAQVPDIESWKINVEYQTKLSEIKKIKNIEINQTEIDLAELTGKDLNKVYQEQLHKEKIRRISELNKKYGVEDKDDEIEKKIEKNTEEYNNPHRLWDILTGKGLVK